MLLQLLCVVSSSLCSVCVQCGVADPRTPRPCLGACPGSPARCRPLSVRSSTVLDVRDSASVALLIVQPRPGASKLPVPATRSRVLRPGALSTVCVLPLALCCRPAPECGSGCDQWLRRVDVLPASVWGQRPRQLAAAHLAAAIPFQHLWHLHHRVHRLAPATPSSGLRSKAADVPQRLLR